MVITRTVCTTSTEAPMRMLGRMYRPRQRPLIRKIGCGNSRHTTSFLQDQQIDFLCCDGETIKAKGKCVYVYHTNGSEPDCKTNEIHLVLEEKNGSFVHVTMHPNENISSGRANTPFEETGFLRTEIHRDYPEGVRMSSN
jgi:hypothetical protein